MELSAYSRANPERRAPLTHNTLVVTSVTAVALRWFHQVSWGARERIAVLRWNRSAELISQWFVMGSIKSVDQTCAAVSVRGRCGRRDAHPHSQAGTPAQAGFQPGEPRAGMCLAERARPGRSQLRSAAVLELSNL